MSAEYASAHLTKSDKTPIIPDSLGIESLNLGIASSGIIFNFGSFLLRATSAIPSNVAKSFTTNALIQSELTARTERSYFLSQEIIS